MESGKLVFEKEYWNTGLWNLEYRSKESGIPLKIGIPILFDFIAKI